MLTAETGRTETLPVHQASFLSRVLCQWEKECSAGLTPPPLNAERSVWVWEGLHRSDDHTRLLGLLHQNARSGQQQESRCKDQFRKVKTSTFSGPEPLQRVDLTTPWTRYWNGLYRLEATRVGSFLAVCQLLLSLLSLWKSDSPQGLCGFLWIYSCCWAMLSVYSSIIRHRYVQQALKGRFICTDGRVKLWVYAVTAVGFILILFVIALTFLLWYVLPSSLFLKKMLWNRRIELFFYFFFLVHRQRQPRRLLLRRRSPWPWPTMGTWTCKQTLIPHAHRQALSLQTGVSLPSHRWLMTISPLSPQGKK